MIKVLRILEGDYGCEERMPGETKKAVVYLKDEDGREVQALIDDDWLYENDIVEGCDWKWNSVYGNIAPAGVEDKAEILALYKTMLYGAADWNENYPNEETIDFDISRNSLFAMKNEYGEIIAVITIDQDPEVEALDCWDKALAPGGELSRLGVRKDMNNKGIAREMMRYAFAELKVRGKKSVHILVKTGHVVALASYSKLGFKQVGECNLFGKDFLCMELAF